METHILFFTGRTIHHQLIFYIMLKLTFLVCKYHTVTFVRVHSKCVLKAFKALKKTVQPSVHCFPLLLCHITYITFLCFILSEEFIAFCPDVQ